MKTTKIKFNGTAFVGIDVHKNSWKDCLISEGGFTRNRDRHRFISLLLYKTGSVALIKLKLQKSFHPLLPYQSTERTIVR